MNIDYNKMIKMVLFLAGMCVVIGMLSRILRQNSESLDDYASANPDIAYSASERQTKKEETAKEISPQEIDLRSNLAVALLNAAQPAENYTLYSEGFYYAPLSDTLKDYITGKSYPGTLSGSGSDSAFVAPVDELYFLHIWYFNFENTPVEGGLICNKAIARDLAEIFCELYRNKYCLKSVLPVDEFDGSCSLSVESDNSFCFGFYETDGLSSLQSMGLAVCINPMYNPFVTFGSDGEVFVFPSADSDYSDRSREFPYKISSDDLCFRLFTEHGFIWGGNLNSSKKYSLFEYGKAIGS